MTVPLNTISNFQSMANIAVNADAVAVRFDFSPQSAAFASWQDGEDCWRVIGDFTTAKAADGGRCELTGHREVTLVNPTSANTILKRVILDFTTCFCQGANPPRCQHAHSHGDSPIT